MNFNKLYYFQEIANQGSIRKASENLYVSQSALSKSLRELEIELGFELFDRHGKRLAINERGKYLLAQVEGILKELEEIKPKMEEKFNSSRVLVVDSLYDELTDVIYRQISVAAPNIHLVSRRKDESPEQKILKLAAGELDILMLPMTDPEYEHIKPLLSYYNIYSLLFALDQLYLSTPKKEPYLSMETCQISDLEKMQLVKCGTDVWSHNLLEKIFAANKKIIRYQHRMSANSFLKIWPDLDYPFATSWLYINHRDFFKGFRKRHQIPIDDPKSKWGIYLLYRLDSSWHRENLILSDKNIFYDIFFPDEDT